MIYLLRAAKSEYFQKKLDSLRSQPYRFWKVINDLTGRGRIRSSPCLSAEALNQQFCSIVGSTVISNVNTSSDATCDFSSSHLPYAPISDFLLVSELDVFYQLCHLDSRKACGPDGIEARFLKAGAAEISASLASIFNASLSSGIVPSDWKCAKVTPVFKSGDRSDPSNYRPISLLSSISKILEHFVFTRLNLFFEVLSRNFNMVSGVEDLRRMLPLCLLTRYWKQKITSSAQALSF